MVLSLFDYNEHRPDTELGTLSFDLAKLAEDASQEDLIANFLKDGKDKGELRYDVSFYPVLKPTVVEGKEELPETSSCFCFCLFYITYRLSRCWYCAADGSSSERA